jgi:hypothetical protein
LAPIVDATNLSRYNPEKGTSKVVNVPASSKKATPYRVILSSKDSHDLAIIVEVNGESFDSIGKIERSKDSIIVEKSTSMPVRNRFCHVESDDLTDVIYSAGSGTPRFRKRYINRQKLASMPKKP